MNPDNLIAFLYILLRDELSAGTVEGIMVNHVEKGDGKRRVYSNPWLASMAADLAGRLLRNPPQRRRRRSTRP
jgi:hypothetical protein